MILYSRHLLKLGIPIPDDAVIRINIAWIPNMLTLISALETTNHEVFIDYPLGRTKPPTVQLSMIDVIRTVFTEHSKIGYLAISNAEAQKDMQKIKNMLPPGITLVPKIETAKGINNLETIVRGAYSNTIMFDSEDLFTNLGCNVEAFEEAVRALKAKVKKLNINMLQLYGVVFSDMP